jgi:hypothetical protein
MVVERLSTVGDAPGDCPVEARRRMQDRRPARPPVFVRKRRSYWQAPMTDEIDQIRQELASEIAAASAAVAAASAALDRLRAASARPAPVAASDHSREPPADLIPPGDAVHLSGLSRGHVYRLCKKYRIDQPGGFAVWMSAENHFMLSKSRFEFFLKHRPRRKKRHKETKKPI